MDRLRSIADGPFFSRNKAACSVHCWFAEETMQNASWTLGFVMMGIALCAATGCTSVAPYERGKLAHPTMSAADGSGFGESHLRAISEGAIGGSAGAGSGCGCN